MKFLRIVLVALTVFVSVSSHIAAAAGSLPDAVALHRRLDEHAPGWLSELHITSIAVAYIDHGALAWTAFYGNQTPDGVAAGEKTLYGVASLTKPISAEVILRAASKGILSIDESITETWTDPDIAGNPWAKELTSRLCLTHQTGFANWRRQTNGVLTFRWQPGTDVGYSGEGYDYAARFAELKSGESFEVLANHLVFEPIGMSSTSYTPQPWWQERQAAPIEPADRSQWNAADLLRTTVADYAHFMISVMEGSQLKSDIQVERWKISRNQWSQSDEEEICAFADSTKRCRARMGFGLGWRVVEINDDTIIDHTGADPGVRTMAFFLPKQQRGAVIFTSGQDIGNKAIGRIVRMLYPNNAYLVTLM